MTTTYFILKLSLHACGRVVSACVQKRVDEPLLKESLLQTVQTRVKNLSSKTGSDDRTSRRSRISVVVILNDKVVGPRGLNMNRSYHGETMYTLDRPTKQFLQLPE